MGTGSNNTVGDISNSINLGTGAEAGSSVCGSTPSFARITVVNNTGAPLSLSDSVLPGQVIFTDIGSSVGAGQSVTGVGCSPFLGPSYTVGMGQDGNTASLTLTNFFGAASVGSVSQNGLSLSWVTDTGASGVGATVTVT